MWLWVWLWGEVSIIIILYPNEDNSARSLKVFSAEHASSTGPTHVMEEGGGATGFLFNS